MTTRTLRLPFVGMAITFERNNFCRLMPIRIDKCETDIMVCMGKFKIYLEYLPT